MDLRITKPRKPEWLAQNLDNPFRGWDGAEHIPAAAAKKAANQYRKTRSQLMKLAAEPGEDAQAQALDAVTAYTQTFNKMALSKPRSGMKSIWPCGASWTPCRMARSRRMPDGEV